MGEGAHRAHVLIVLAPGRRSGLGEDLLGHELFQWAFEEQPRTGRPAAVPQGLEAELLQPARLSAAVRQEPRHPLAP